MGKQAVKPSRVCIVLRWEENVSGYKTQVNCCLITVAGWQYWTLTAVNILKVNSTVIFSEPGHCCYDYLLACCRLLTPSVPQLSFNLTTVGGCYHKSWRSLSNSHIALVYFSFVLVPVCLFWGCTYVGFK